MFLPIREILREGMWQFFPCGHSSGMYICRERFRGVDPSVYYSEIRHPFLLILCKQSRPYQENRKICQNLGKKLTTLAQFGTTTENCLVTPYMHQGTLAIVIFHGLSSNFTFERLLLAIVLDLGSGSGI